MKKATLAIGLAAILTACAPKKPVEFGISQKQTMLVDINGDGYIDGDRRPSMNYFLIAPEFVEAKRSILTPNYQIMTEEQREMARKIMELQKTYEEKR